MLGGTSRDLTRRRAWVRPAGVFLARIEALRQWLVARPEKSILVVAHWGVIEALTSDEFENCEARGDPVSRRPCSAALQQLGTRGADTAEAARC